MTLDMSAGVGVVTAMIAGDNDTAYEQAAAMDPLDRLAAIACLASMTAALVGQLAEVRDLETSVLWEQIAVGYARGVT